MSANGKSSGLLWSINGRFLTQRITGVQRYASQLTDALATVVNANGSQGRIEIVAPPDATQPDFSSIPFRTAGTGSGQWWEQVTLPDSSGEGIISLCNTGPLRKRKQVVCIHDTNVFSCPESYSRSFRWYYKSVLPMLGRRTAKILTVSKTSADMLVKCGVARAEKIEVVPNGHEHAFGWDASQSTLLQEQPPTRPFALVIGSRAPHKNIQLVHQIAEGLDQLGVDIYISGGSSSIFSSEQKSPVASNIRFLGYVTDHDLASLYSQALCLLFPSHQEGFGLPLVEAMALGCPVVSSNTSCMPEIVGEHGVLVAPTDPAAWVEAVAAIKSGSVQFNRQAVATHLKQFSWQRSAEKLYSILESLEAMP